MPGIDRRTGRALGGWEHVVQSLQIIFTTRFHERVMRRFFGSLVLAMLGENITEPTVIRFFYAVAVAIELWEPRFRLVRITINDASREGELSFKVEGVYYPNAHLQDFTTYLRRSLIVIAGQTGVRVRNSFEKGIVA